jgi:hypothetical protein
MSGDLGSLCDKHSQMEKFLKESKKFRRQGKSSIWSGIAVAIVSGGSYFMAPQIVSSYSPIMFIAGTLVGACGIRRLRQSKNSRNEYNFFDNGLKDETSRILKDISKGNSEYVHVAREAACRGYIGWPDLDTALMQGGEARLRIQEGSEEQEEHFLPYKDWTPETDIKKEH